MKRFLFPLAFILGIAAAALGGLHSPAHSLATIHFDTIHFDTIHFD